MIAAAAVASAIGIAAAVVAPRWPYSETMLVPAAQEIFETTVHVQQFHRFYFPHPGCSAEYLSLARPDHAAGAPLVMVQRVTMIGRYSDLVFRSHHFAEIRLDGLYVRIPSRSTREGFKWQRGNESQISAVSIGSITANDAVLEIESEKKEQPMKFEIHKLRLESVASGQAMSYQVSMGNPEPPGEVESRGKFGPWIPGQIGKIAVEGTAKLTSAKLDKYHGIGGTLDSNERFGGVLEQIDVNGEGTVRDFVVKSARHRVRLTSEFHVVVDGTKGEAQLREVEAKIGRTTAHVQGSIRKDQQRHRRETSLAFTIQHGRAEDLLWLFNSASKPPMLGNADCSGEVRVVQFGPGFLERLRMQGRFEVRDGHFQRKTQEKTNELSARATGKKVKEAADAPEVSVESLASEVTMQKAIAHFSNLYFQVPGANARMHGTYSFLNDTVDLHGDLQTNASISQESSGIKSVLMKPLDPFFRKKHAGAQVPVVMSGAMDAPHFGLEYPQKK